MTHTHISFPVACFDVSCLNPSSCVYASTSQSVCATGDRLFGLLKAGGVVLDGPTASSVAKSALFGLNAFIAQPLLTLVQDMDSENFLYLPFL